MPGFTRPALASTSGADTTAEGPTPQAAKAAEAWHAVEPSTATTKPFPPRGQSAASTTLASGVSAANRSTARRTI